MKKILIVDNALDEREDVYNILLLEGYQVFHCFINMINVTA